MIRRIAMLILIGFAIVLIDFAPAGNAAGLLRIYFPLVQKPPPVEVVVTAYGVECPECYPSYSYVFGYLRVIPGEPPAHVVLELDETVEPYVPPGFSHPNAYTATVQFAPAFSVTLAGQINPFSYVVANGKGFTELSSAVRISQVTPVDAGEHYYPLSAVAWNLSDQQLSGVVRNDGPAALSDLRIVVLGPGLCDWQPASLAAATLQPGQATTFSTVYYCGGADLQILGQGVAQ